ncbi:MAG: TonB C-terminal domain-containing protein [Campylobacterota bacterium]|nr:TonB C-terminal domain-containing protein [Campylobacterota bacterium]
MDDNKTLFLLSGFFSLSLFALIIFLFVSMMFSSKKPNSFAKKKDTFISISIQASVEKVKENKTLDIPVSSVAPSPSSVENAQVNIDDLFSDVWTKKITKKKPKKKNIDKQRIKDIQKKIVVKKDKSVKQSINKDKIKNMLESEENKKSSTANEVNEYLAKIQAIVYNHFMPPPNSQGHTVKAVIELSAIGKMLDFRIITYSSNQALNQECDKMKARLLGVLFPVNPDNKSITKLINITSDKN